MDLDTARQVARLARLELGEGDLAEYARHLTAILDYVDQLKPLDTDDVEPLAHPLPLQNIFRGDVPEPSLSPDEALANAPRRSGDCFAVPAVFDSPGSS